VARGGVGDDSSQSARTGRRAAARALNRSVVDWQALALSLELAAVTRAVLLPPGLWLGCWLATTS
jgi:hypothetical protein